MRTITIGRAPTCDIVVNDPDVSRIHAEISVAGGQYVFRDVSTNGTIVNGRKINNEKVYVMPDSRILLADSIPFPWNKVMSLLPLSSDQSGRQTVPRQHNAEPVYHNAPYNNPQPVPEPLQPAVNDSLGVGWGILAFFLPIAGWIMYFVWKDETPKRAGTAGIIGIIGFVFNLMIIFS